MAPSKKYADNVVDLVDGLVDSKFKKELEEQVQARQIVTALVAERVASGVSQADVAKALGCKQPRVSKIENKTDVDLTVGEIATYCKLAGRQIEIVGHHKDATIVDRVKTYAYLMNEELRQIAVLAHKDDSIAEGAEQFFGEAFFNCVRLIQETAKQLPQRPDISLKFDEHSPEVTAPKELPKPRRKKPTRKRAPRKEPVAR
jgi:transcriptional regulator with XRE-family HTH domain